VTQTLEIRDSLNEVNAASWNALTTDNNPFVQYEFLHGLQASDCLGADKGWYPLYFLLWSEPSADNEEPALLAAMATYVKTHSYGEFVFDWAWADAYQRSNLDYYPKLICAVPYTPATGPRILVRADQPFKATAQLLARGACQYAQEQNFSSVHWLFTRPEECQALCGTTERSLPSAIATGENSDDTTAKTGDPTTENESSLGLLQRIDVQYHWRNEGYQSFDDFLAQCTAGA